MASSTTSTSAGTSKGAGDKTLRVAFIGAGGVNFGSVEGPWDHASRLERLALTDPIVFVGIADVYVPLAEKRIKDKTEQEDSSLAAAWKDCRAFKDFRVMLREAKPDAVVIGLPPFAHGALEGEAAVERACIAAGVHCFVEKPLSVRSPAEVAQLAQTLQTEADRANLVVAVGYMLRYSDAVTKAKELLKGRKIAAIVARYCCAYKDIRKSDFWCIPRSGGPVVEQGTHFCDLIRYFAGDVDMDTVTAVHLPHDAAAAHLSLMPPAPEAEHNVDPRDRIPRVTSSVFRFKEGAVGTFTHGLMLHGSKYHTEIEIWADGMRLVLEDLYESPALYVRRGGDGADANETVAVPLPSNKDQGLLDDMYGSEIRTFISAIRSGDQSDIRSPYSDSVNTYLLSCAIRDRAAEPRSPPSAEPVPAPASTSPAPITPASTPASPVPASAACCSWKTALVGGAVGLAVFAACSMFGRRCSTRR